LKVSKVYKHDHHECPDVDYFQGDLILNKNNVMALQAATDNALTCANLDPSMANTAAQMVQQAAQRAVALGEQNYRSNLNFLKLIISKMGALPGQRILILVSSGFLTPSSEAMELKSQLLDIAARGNVTINSVDASGLSTSALDVSQEAGGSPLDVQQRALRVEVEMTAKENVMAELADGTGGTYFHNNNNLEAGFLNVISGSKSVYLLAFSPANVQSKRGYHELKVKVNQSGLTVQARRGYFAPESARGKK
jgi:VWFA-related protein